MFLSCSASCHLSPLIGLCPCHVGPYIWCATKKPANVLPWRRLTDKTWFLGIKSSRCLWNVTSSRSLKIRLWSPCSVLLRPGGTYAWSWSMLKVNGYTGHLKMHTNMNTYSLTKLWITLWTYLHFVTLPPQFIGLWNNTVELCCFVPVLLILRLMETWLVENLKWKFLWLSSINRFISTKLSSSIKCRVVLFNSPVDRFSCVFNKLSPEAWRCNVII